MGYLLESHSLLKCFLFILLLSLSNSIRLDESGYYELVVAIDETTAQNSIDEYIDNVKYAIQDLSDLLHFTTKSKFSIRKVNILVPVHWNVPGTEAATSEFFDGADIKISHRHYLPSVDNPKPCGNPGESILLPYDFFNEHDVGEYGRQGKALLTQFTRLRYGVWEEHGYPGDSRFPYYWKQLNKKDWEVTACTDVPVSGSYRDVNTGEECGPDPEDVDNLYPPPSTCRFIPDIAQAAKSSIMTYHHLPTVDQFCTSENHNKEAPNSQNFFCKYKSVMEVIESSPDWQQTTLENTDAKVEFKVVKNTGSPLFYVLLDGGKSQAPVSVLKTISSSLKNLVGDKELRNLVAGVGAFPGHGTKPYASLVPWSYLRTDNVEVMIAFDSAFGSTVGFRNYPEALKSIADEIKVMNHKEGAAILIVKTGDEPNPGLTPENEVTASILGANVKVFAIEIQGNALHSALALKTVAEKSGGIHLPIGNPNDIKVPLDTFMATLTETLKAEIHPTLNYKVVTKEIIPLGGKISLEPGEAKIIDWKMYLVPLVGTITDPLFIDAATSFEVKMSERIDWGQSALGSKKSYFYEWNGPSPARVLGDFSYQCQGTCEVLITVLVAFESPVPAPEDNINVFVSTSAINGEVDMNFVGAGTDLGVPFAIYARIDNDGIPMHGDENLVVTATVYPSDFSGVKKVELKDDGTSIPDASKNDGVYSGVFVPKVSGVYKIFVTASYAKPPPSTTTPTSRLMPVDQQNFGCGSGFLSCWSEPPEFEFKKTQDLSGGVTFTNAENYENNANILFGWRITDLEVIPLDDYRIILRWTAPGYHMNAGSGAGVLDFYHAVHDESFEKVLNECLGLDDNCEQLDMQYTRPGYAGEVIEAEFRIGRETKRYFAIRTNLRGVVGKVTPLIVGVSITEELVSSTSTTTTTTIRPTTSSTTTRPTIITETTIEEEETTTVMNTRTTPIRSTTPRSTTAKPATTRKTTVLPSTTTEKSVKHWYQEKEGIITLSVFGGAILLLLTGGLAYFWFIRR